MKLIGDQWTLNVSPRFIEFLLFILILLLSFTIRYLLRVKRSLCVLNRNIRSGKTSFY